MSLHMNFTKQIERINTLCNSLDNRDLCNGHCEQCTLFKALTIIKKREREEKEKEKPNEPKEVRFLDFCRLCDDYTTINLFLPDSKGKINKIEKPKFFLDNSSQYDYIIKSIHVETLDFTKSIVYIKTKEK